MEAQARNNVLPPAIDHDWNDRHNYHAAVSGPESSPRQLSRFLVRIPQLLGMRHRKIRQNPTADPCL
jgi:hypothetical protein